MKSPGLAWAIAGCLGMGGISLTLPATASVPPSLPAPLPEITAQAPAFDYEDFDFWAEQCVLLQAAGEYESAVTSCEQAISLRPDDENMALWSARGAAQFHLGQYVEALVSYQRVTAVMPEDATTLTHQCAVLVQLDQFETAAATCTNAIQIDSNWDEPTRLTAWYYKGLALQGLGHWQQALETFSHARVYDPTDPRLEAEVCILSEELDQWGGCSLGTAADAYDRALAADPQNLLLWYRQGLVLEQLGRYHQALVSYQRAVTARPDNTLALAHQCAVLNELQQFEAAIAACEAAFQGNNQWDVLGPAYGWSQTSAAQIGLGDYEAALASADRAIALNPDYLGGWHNQAVSLWHLDLYEDALEAITTERETPAPEPFLFERRRRVLATFNEGLILYRLGRYQEAIVAYSHAIALQELGQSELGEDGTLVDAEFLANVWTSLANAQMARQRFSEATASAFAATQHSPTATDAWYTLALAFLGNNNYIAALQAYQQAAQLQPERTDILMGQGITLKQVGCFDEAFQVFGSLLNLDPTNPTARQAYSELLDIQRQPAIAPTQTTTDAATADPTAGARQTICPPRTGAALGE